MASLKDSKRAPKLNHRHNEGLWALRVWHPRSIIDPSNVFKTPIEQEFLWAEECAKIADVKPEQVQQFRKYPIRAWTMLQLLNASLVKYRMHAVDIRGVYAAPMEQHRFPWAQSCEDLFISWSEYEESHPFQEIPQMNC